MAERLGPSGRQSVRRSTPATFGDVVMLTVPLKAVPDLAPDLAPALSGKTVLDTGNAYERRDGTAAQARRPHPQGSAGWAAAKFPGSRWVKAFNTVYSRTSRARRIGRGTASAFRWRATTWTRWTWRPRWSGTRGSNPVVVGPLARGKEFEPDTTPYNTGMSGRRLRALFGQVDKQ